MNISKYISAILAVFISCTVLINSSNAKELSEELVLKKGDVVTQLQENSSWSVVKVLEIDKWPDGTYTAHCLTYKQTSKKPKLNSIDTLEIFAFHAPIDAASFSTGWDLIGNDNVKDGELIGFVEYLKITDFPRYAKFTKQDVNALVSEANTNYKNAIAAGEEGNHIEAVALYSKAIDLFPLFYEAIDNRAFTYMDMGEYSKAISDFSQSLQVNPDGLTAFFSIGECLLKLGRYTEAMKIFNEGMVKFPEREALFKGFYEKAAALGKNG
jgi:tetratricopeptide (TPR) repeat protein